MYIDKAFEDNENFIICYGVIGILCVFSLLCTLVARQFGIFDVLDLPDCQFGRREA